MSLTVTFVGQKCFDVGFERLSAALGLADVLTGQFDTSRRSREARKDEFVNANRKRDERSTFRKTAPRRHKNMATDSSPAVVSINSVSLTTSS